MKKLLTLALAVLMIFALVACDSSESGGTLNVAARVAVSDGYLPHKMAGYAFMVTTLPMYETLFVYEGGKVVGNLVESYEADKDALTYTLKIKEGVKFHDGSELTADVVGWNLMFYKENATRNYCANIAGYTVIDDYTVQIDMAAWDMTLIGNLCLYPGIMTSKKAFEEKGMDELNMNPVGTGPYKFASHEPGVNVVYEKFEDYHGGKPNFDEVVVNIFSDENTIVSSLQSGEIDMAIGQSDALAGLIDFDVKTAQYQVFSSTYILAMATTNPDHPLYDVRVRQAVCYAIDSESMFNALTYGASQLTEQWAIPGSAFDYDIPEYGYDLEKAKSLMAEAGYADGFAMPIYITAGTTYEDMAAVLQADLAKIGIDLQIQTTSTEFFTWMCNFNDGVLMGDCGNNANMATQYGCFATGGVGVGQTAWARTAELDAMVKAAKEEASSIQESADILKDLSQYVVADQAYYYGLYTAPSVVYMNTNLEGTGVEDVQWGTLSRAK